MKSNALLTMKHGVYQWINCQHPYSSKVSIDKTNMTGFWKENTLRYPKGESDMNEITDAHFHYEKNPTKNNTKHKKEQDS